jgi:hypothetical protein
MYRFKQFYLGGGFHFSEVYGADFDNNSSVNQKLLGEFLTGSGVQSVLGYRFTHFMGLELRYFTTSYAQVVQQKNDKFETKDLNVVLRLEGFQLNLTGDF